MIDIYERVLIRGLDDWVTMTEVVFEATFDPQLAVAAVRRALRDATMQAGDVDREGFVAWPLPPDEAADRISAELSTMDINDLNPGDIAWLRNTPAGNQLAEAALSREERGTTA
ncbi:hypothetical protein ACIBF5_30250 [Micromonospora sp. NPDC050417]|uniref:hypothetical protein n=1 Tax=Micromonospora sp. NPDC050417 TaxID=3364280 RepID=UPI003797ACD0